MSDVLVDNTVSTPNFGQRILNFINPWKEIALICLGITYAFGLISWQLYALWNGFGYVAALNLQYFTSGLWFMFCFVSLAIIFGLLFYYLEINAQNILLETKNSTEIQKFGRILGWIRITIRWFVIIFLGALCALPICSIFYGFAFDKLIAIILSVSLIIYFINVIQYNNDHPLSKLLEDDETLSQENLWGKRVRSNWWVLVLAIISSLLIYARWIYPNLPQEVGGGRSKLCYIDMEKDKMSDWITSELVTPTPDDKIESRRKNVAAYLGITVATTPVGLDSKLKVLHSKELDLWFDSTDYIIVRVHENLNDSPKLDRKVIRIPKSLFMTITIHEKSYEQILNDIKEN